MSYDNTIAEVLDQYELSPAQREDVTRSVMASPCPWSRAIAYSRTHALAAAAEHGTKMEFTS
jgi:hypothetical protein